MCFSLEYKGHALKMRNVTISLCRHKSCCKNVLLGTAAIFARPKGFKFHKSRSQKALKIGSHLGGRTECNPIQTCNFTNILYTFEFVKKTILQNANCVYLNMYNYKLDFIDLTYLVFQEE